jgi:hypothetical protein
MISRPSWQPFQQPASPSDSPPNSTDPEPPAADVPERPRPAPLRFQDGPPTHHNGGPDEDTGQSKAPTARPPLRRRSTAPRLTSADSSGPPKDRGPGTSRQGR